MIATIAIVILVVIVLLIVWVLVRYFPLWLMAYVTGTRISIVSLFLMSLRRIDPGLVVRCQIMLVQAGLERIALKELESQVLAGGHLERITQALIAAHRSGIDLSWDVAAAIDLAGRDILDAVRVSVNPKVINCPATEDHRKATLDGVAKDGIQIRVRALVTVHTNLAKLIGGATEATVVARVGEGIVSAIGKCENYQAVLADPMVITRLVLRHGLDSQTAFQIVSIDIADMDVGENIGARLQIDQAATDMRLAQALAEKRRALALANLQEMHALTQENRANVVLAEAKIPQAIAESFRNGNLGLSRSYMGRRERNSRRNRLLSR